MLDVAHYRALSQLYCVVQNKGKTKQGEPLPLLDLPYHPLPHLLRYLPPLHPYRSPQCHSTHPPHQAGPAEPLSPVQKTVCQTFI